MNLGTEDVAVVLLEVHTRFPTVFVSQRFGISPYPKSYWKKDGFGWKQSHRRPNLSIIYAEAKTWALNEALK